MHIFVITHFHESFASSIVAIEDVLQNFQHFVGGAVLAIPLLQIHLEILLRGDLGAIGAGHHDLLSAHAPTFCSEVDAFTGALGHIASRVAHQGHAADHAPGAGMLGDRMGFHLDDFTVQEAFLGPFADAFLQALDQALVVLHGSRTHGDVVVFREDPGIEIWGDIGSHIHFRQALVVLHLFRGQLDALLESDGHVVVASIHRFGNPAVGSIGPNNQIHFQRFALAGGLARRVVRVGEGVRPLPLAARIDLGH